MAREPIVSRTIQTTIATILCVNTENGETFTTDVKLPRMYKDDAHILKAAEKIVSEANVKAVHVQKAVVMNERYGMTEAKFIENAEILPPLTRTANELETEN